MTGKKIAIIAGSFAAWVLLPAGVQAFEQQAPAMSQPPSARSAVQPDARGLPLDEKAANPASKEARKGMKIPGLGTLTVPQLNFGLDLMYGEDRKDDQNLGFTNDPLTEDGVTIMGKVKRRF